MVFSDCQDITEILLKVVLNAITPLCQDITEILLKVVLNAITPLQLVFQDVNLCEELQTLLTQAVDEGILY
jgi:hypothetical protein